MPLYYPPSSASSFDPSKYNGVGSAVYSTFDRAVLSASATAGASTTGTLRMSRIILPAGFTVTNIIFWSGTTALSVGVNQWFALFDSSRNKLAISADDTSTAWGASAAKSLAMTAPYLIPTSGLYYIGYCIVATTVPTIESAPAALLATGSRNAAFIPGGNSTASLTNPASCPSPAGAITPLAQLSYGEVS